MKFSIKNSSVSVTLNEKRHFLCNDIEKKEQGRYLKLLAKNRDNRIRKNIYTSLFGKYLLLGEMGRLVSY